MFTKLVRWLMGSKIYLVPPCFSNKATAILMKSGAYYRKLRSTDNGLSFSLMRRDSDAIERIFKKYGVEFKLIRETGLYRLIYKYRKRYGIVVGAILFSIIIFASERFIWNVRVSGNESVSSEEITQRLSNLGFGIGTPISSVDFDKLHNEYLLRYDDTAWIAVNLHGTVANVEVIESKRPLPAADESLPHNLVAREDGIITYMEVYRGQPIARENELVREGELLASGIEEGKHGFSLVHARGKVLAAVKRNIKIEVPQEETLIMRSGTAYNEKYLNIFGFSFKFSKSGGNLPDKYDKIESEHKIKIFDFVEIPVSVSNKDYYELVPTVVSYTPEEAKSEAYRRLSIKTTECLSGGELAGRKITAGLIDGIYTIECELSVICDIAKELPIHIGESSQR